MIRDMAMGELTDRELALRINCELATIKAFRALYTDEIAEVRAALAGQLALDTAGLWISKRANRVAELESDLEIINKAMRELVTDEEGNFWPMMIASREFNRLLSAKHAILSQASNEYALNDKRNSDAERVPTRYILEMEDEIREALS